MKFPNRIGRKIAAGKCSAPVVPPPFRRQWLFVLTIFLVGAVSLAGEPARWSLSYDAGYRG